MPSISNYTAKGSESSLFTGTIDELAIATSRRGQAVDVHLDDGNGARAFVVAPMTGSCSDRAIFNWKSLDAVRKTNSFLCVSPTPKRLGEISFTASSDSDVSQRNKVRHEQGAYGGIVGDHGDIAIVMMLFTGCNAKNKGLDAFHEQFKQFGGWTYVLG